MRALFLVPPSAYNPLGSPIDRVYGCNYGFDTKPPIHLLQVASFARERLGWAVRLLDCPAEGVDRRDFEAMLAEGLPYDVVVHWATYLSAIEDVAAARAIATRHPQMRFVFMGAAATWRPEEFDIDGRAVCLLGEPEHTLRELHTAWRDGTSLEGIPGLAWFDADGQLQRGPFRDLLDVTTLPMPDRRLLTGRYRANRLDTGPITVMALSRGCGFRCTFCLTNAMDQAIELEFKRLQPTYTRRPPLRKRRVDQIIAEFQDIAALGYRGVEIADNVFTWGKQRTLDICAGVEPLGLRWICLARATMLHDPELVGAMGRAGCQVVYMGSESFDDGLLDDMVKEIKVQDVLRAVQVCRSSGVEPEISVLIGGSPNETWRTLLHSWRAARRLGTRFVHFSAALPAPSTALYDQALAEGWFVDGDFRPVDNQREAIVDLPHLSSRELRLALKLGYALQYLAPSALLHQARTVRSLDDLQAKLGGASRLLGFLSRRRPPAPVPAGRVTPP